MKVAIVYDRANTWGGAERVLLTLHEMLPDAPLFTSVYSDKHAQWAEVFPRIHTSFLQNIPFAKRRHQILPLFMPIAFESFNFDNYDLVISVTSEAAKGIITGGKTKHICYCLTPTRYLWSGYTEYFKNPVLKTISKYSVDYLRRWDVVAAKRPDVIIGISKEVQKRIKQYYNRDSHLIYPPVNINRFKKEKRQMLKLIQHDGAPLNGYFLIVSRLVPYKKVDLAIEVFNQLRLPLVIVGTGSEEKRLKRMAKRNIIFKGHIPENELSTYYSHAQGFIFPQEEDFGITAVEAQAHGVPVVAFKKGGSLDTVIHGKTGVFFEEQSIESLSHAMKQVQNVRFKIQNLRKNAEKFSKNRFKSKFEKQVTNLLRHS